MRGANVIVQSTIVTKKVAEVMDTTKSNKSQNPQ